LPDDTAGHLLLDHALPRVLSLSGRILIHASAVVTQGGEAIAFVGPSGHGKSTLAASFYRAGFGLLTDDCLQLDPRNDQVFALSAYPSLRLWSASANALFPDFMDFRSVAHYSSKQQVLLAGDDGSVAQPTPLKAVFVLEDPENVGGSERVRIEPLGGTLAAKAMIDSTFVLDNKDRGRVERMFTQMLFIVRTGLPYYRLAYPRVYEQLDAVQSAVLDVIEG
jgi:hypothetical protein